MVPNHEQLRAIESTAAHTLVIAGPGSGKTATLVERIKWLIDHDTPEVRHRKAADIIAVTFTNAAAAEMKDRLTAAGIVEPLGYLGNLHGLALREIQRVRGCKLSILDDEQALEMLVSVARHCGCKVAEAKLWEHREAWIYGQQGGSKPIDIAVQTYLRELYVNYCVDFHSILEEFLACLRKVENTVRRYEHLLVDEYQDSGDMDARIYAAMPVTNRFFVGDPDQSMYSFRGAKVANLLDLTRNGSGWSVITLEGNYRCAPNICRAANDLISRNRARYPKFTAPMFNSMSDVSVFENGLDSEEVNRVLRDVERVTNAGLVTVDQVAILSRGNFLAGEFVAAAEAMGLPIRKKRHNKMPEDWKLCRATLDILADGKNSVKLRHWLRVRYGPGALAIEREADKAQKQIWEMVAELSAIESHHQRAVNTQLFVDLESLGVSAESVNVLSEKASTLLDDNISTLIFALASELEHREETGKGVTITTIHGAKGREWEYVYLVGCDGPEARVWGDIEEERRIMFVGITRAKSRLVFSYAKQRKQTWGRKLLSPVVPSQFIKEATL